MMEMPTSSCSSCFSSASTSSMQAWSTRSFWAVSRCRSWMALRNSGLRRAGVSNQLSRGMPRSEVSLGLQAEEGGTMVQGGTCFKCPLGASQAHPLPLCSLPLLT